MNLVMIGKFRDEGAAAEALEAITRLEAQVRKDDPNSDELYVDDDYSPSDKYSNEMLDLLGEIRFHDVRPEELEQFTYDVRVEQVAESIKLLTDESDISAFLKLFLHKGARVEVYSAHFHNRDES